MSRRSSRKKGAIGEQSSEMPYQTGRAATQSRLPLDHGVRSSKSFAQARDLLVAPGGAVLASWPMYDALFTGQRPAVMSMGYSASNGSYLSSPNTLNSMPTNIISSETNFIAQGLIDNIARTYANAQNLSITTPADLNAYLTDFKLAYGDAIMLASVLNGDGFNGRMQQLSTNGNQFRSRIQTALDRLQELPMPPGYVDMCDRMFGAFAAAEGSTVFLSGISSTTGAPPDLTTNAGWSTTVTAIENLLTGLATAVPEANVIRTVLAEYYGNPVAFKMPGVKICRPLYEQFLLQGAWFLGATNIIGFPYTQNGTVSPTADSTVPIVVPRTAIGDPLWATLFKPNAYVFANNVPVGANKYVYGFAVGDTANSTKLGYYGVDQTSAMGTSSPVTTFNGYTDPMNDFYWWPPVGNSETTGYSSDLRSFRDYVVFETSMSTLASNSVYVLHAMMLEKARYPLPSDCKLWTTEKVHVART